MRKAQIGNERGAGRAHAQGQLNGRRMVQRGERGNRAGKAPYLSAVLVAGMASKKRKKSDGKLKGWGTLQKRQEWRVWGVWGLEKKKEEKKVGDIEHKLRRQQADRKMRAQRGQQRMLLVALAIVLWFF